MGNLQLESHTTAKSKRIVRNTLTLFVRMFLIMGINLYALRVILNRLGEEDYGTYNAVAGIVLSGAFLTTTLSLALQRFYSFYIGRKDEIQLQKIYSASLNTIAILSLILFVLFETIGLWFLNCQLSIPDNLMLAANRVYQFSLLSFVFTLFQVPFTAAIFAHEDIHFFAFISLFDCTLRLVAALLIGFFPIDGLTFYGLGLLCVTGIVLALYVIVVKTHYSAFSYKRRIERAVYKEFGTFSGWTFLGALAGVMTTQGNILLLNVFFGALTTAAYGIALQVLNAFQALANSLVVAFRPAMVKSYAEQDNAFLSMLFSIENKCIYFLLLATCIPLAIEMPDILQWWLQKVPAEAVMFTRLIIVYFILLALSSPVTTIVQATGRIKNYSIRVECLMMLSLPVAWFLFKLGAPSWVAIASMIVLCALAHAVRLVCLHQVWNGFYYKPYLTEFLLPGAVVGIGAFIAALYVHHIIAAPVGRFFAVAFTTVLCVGALTYAVGISRSERLFLHRLIQKTSKRLRPC